MLFQSVFDQKEEGKLLRINLSLQYSCYSFICIFVLFIFNSCKDKE